jgi:hypothetical protein
MKAKKQKRNFSSFTPAEAFQELGVQELKRWKIKLQPYKPSPFLSQRLRRLEIFDLALSERAKELSRRPKSIWYFER